MRIFIVGAGEVGYHIASSLCGEGHDLVVIERDAERARRLHKELDVLVVTGDGCDARVLKQNGVGDSALFFAVSNDDASNLLAAATARRLGAGKCVVRVGRAFHGLNPLITDDDKILPLYPERLVAEEIHALTRVPGASKAHFFADGKLVLVKVRPSLKADIYGRPLKDIHGPEGWILTGIFRADGLLIPRGDTVLRGGDVVYAVGRADNVPEFMSSIGIEANPTRRVVIAGGGQVGFWLSKLLCSDTIDVTVIQRGAQRAFDLATEVPKALVLRGNATDPEMLREARVDEADYFIAATQDDEANILSSLLARELGAKHEVTLFHRREFREVLSAIRIDLPISPRVMIAGSILRMVHGSEIVNLDLIEEGDAEVVEFEVPAGAKVLKKSLEGLRVPRESIIGAVMRGDELFVPRGSFQFQVGDRALVFTMNSALPALERMFQGR
ncbi:hypothetical protein ABI59_11465 [Acidobacteria bacterium Mor1]|nr:hypothetical protein ABI59_11465 [Acidobacteria bacterium Mor1]